CRHRRRQRRSGKHSAYRPRAHIPRALASSNAIKGSMQREVALDVVIACVKDAIEQFGSGEAVEVTADTVIVGPSAALDSIAVVSLIVDIEQRLETDHNVAITLA